jgi:hypothetical protein
VHLTDSLPQRDIVSFIRHTLLAVNLRRHPAKDAALVAPGDSASIGGTFDLPYPHFGGDSSRSSLTGLKQTTRRARLLRHGRPKHLAACARTTWKLNPPLILTGPEVAAARPKCPHHLTTPRGVVCVSFRTGCGRRNRVEISIEKGWVTGKDHTCTLRQDTLPYLG